MTNIKSITTREESAMHAEVPTLSILNQACFVEKTNSSILFDYMEYLYWNCLQSYLSCQIQTCL